MGGEYQGREPCPARILDDIGGAFSMGLVGGGIWHAVKGARNAPKGLNHRIYYAVDAIKARAPVTGGSFATWGALFATFDCSFAAIRAKEDPWNSIGSGAATGAVLAMRAGPRAAAKNAAIGGLLLAAIEGLGIMITKMMAPPTPTPEEYAKAGTQDPLEPPSAFGALAGGLAGGGSSLGDIFGNSSLDEPSSASNLFDDAPSGGLSPSPSQDQEPAKPKKSWYNPF